MIWEIEKYFDQKYGVDCYESHIEFHVCFWTLEIRWAK